MSDTRAPSERVDVCVVGAGVAGALVAYSLAERGHDVVVLEAGERFDLDEQREIYEQLEQAIRPEVSRAELWGMREPRDSYTTDLDDGLYFRLNEQRTKAVGGATLHWAGYTPRLHEKDFEMQSRYGLASDWPISYEDLRPYYARAERELGVAGAGGDPYGPPREEPFPMDPFPQSYTDRLFTEACAELGIETHPIPQARNSTSHDGRSACLNYGTCVPFCPSGAKYDGRVHVRKAEAAGARIVDRVPAQSIEHDESGDRVEAVRYATPDGTVHRQEARHVVLACGGIETPRLLLLSDSEQYPDGLANSSGAVGRYFHVGLSVSTRAELDRPAQQEPVGFATRHSTHFYDHDDPTPGSVLLTFRNENPPSPVRNALGSTDVASGLLPEVVGDTWGDELLEEIREVAGSSHRGVRVTSSVDQLPTASNRIELDPSRTDDLGNPVPKVTFSVGERARRTMERGLEIHREIFEELGAEIVDEGTPGEGGLGNHHKGTTRMGTDPAESVVNAQCRTHDLDNCWIASASVFTTGGAMNPTLTIAALALRTADAIDDRL